MNVLLYARVAEAERDESRLAQRKKNGMGNSSETKCWQHNIHEGRVHHLSAVLVFVCGVK